MIILNAEQRKLYDALSALLACVPGRVNDGSTIRARLNDAAATAAFTNLGTLPIPPDRVLLARDEQGQWHIYCDDEIPQD